MSIWDVIVGVCLGVGMFLLCVLAWAGLSGRFHEACGLCALCGKRPWRFSTSEGLLCERCKEHLFPARPPDIAAAARDQL